MTNLGRDEFNEWLEKPLVLEGETDSGEGVKVTVPLQNATLGALNNVVRAKSGDLTTVPYDWLDLEPTTLQRSDSDHFVVTDSGIATYLSLGDKLRVKLGATGEVYYYIVGVQNEGKLIRVVRDRDSGSTLNIPDEKILSVAYTKSTTASGFDGWMEYVPTITASSSATTVNGVTSSYFAFVVSGGVASVCFRVVVDLTVNSGIGSGLWMTLPFEIPSGIPTIYTYATVIPNSTGSYHGWASISEANRVGLFSWDGFTTGTTFIHGQFVIPIKKEQ